ncbi:endonuclease III domain-containing protein [Candidatus Woesearchaeota archaeon]|nr:endonuclease III domain-containing protein [Candidatus Woesearchaeota archaeon]MBW3005541.1 endonuclease III domain-containing protein [Candidatus Woesearchaeota archaeon]
MYNVYKILFKEYGPQNWWPVTTKNKRFETIIGAVLTQNTSWKNVENAIANLRKAGLIDPVKIVKASDKVIAEAIRPSGYFNQKTERLKIISDFILKNSNISRLPVEDLRNKLLEIKGVGPETADSIILYAYNKPSFVVDLYTKRIFSRLGICRQDVKYEELQGLFHEKLKKDAVLFNEYHALIVEHAKRFCKKVPDCAGCPLIGFCKKRF